MNKPLITLVSLLVLLAPTTFVKAAEPHSSQQQKYTVAIENYLNSLQSYEADFIQHSTDNKPYRKGKLYINKPDQIKLEYFTPEHEILIIDHDLITFYNEALDELNYTPNEGLPIGLLSKKHLDLQRDTKLKSIDMVGDRFVLETEFEHNSQKSAITIVFNRKPFDISRIITSDESEDSVQIEITSSRHNPSINPFIFKLKRKDPRRR